MNLSINFAKEEFECDGDRIPDDCVASFVCLCENILEPIRAYARLPLIVTSGYRSIEENSAAHGVATSQHIATSHYCAADWRIEMLPDLRGVFDWIRLKSGLRIDQLILEHSPSKHDVIHASWAVNLPRLDALEGQTANRGAYTRFPFNNAAKAEDYSWMG